MSEGRRSERALDEVENENAPVAIERISTRKISIVGASSTFSDEIKLALNLGRGGECRSDVQSPPLTPRVLEVA